MVLVPAEVLLVLLLLSLPELEEFLHLLLTEGLACRVMGGDTCAHVGVGRGGRRGCGCKCECGEGPTKG